MCYIILLPTRRVRLRRGGYKCHRGCQNTTRIVVAHYNNICIIHTPPHSAVISLKQTRVWGYGHGSGNISVALRVYLYASTQYYNNLYSRHRMHIILWVLLWQCGVIKKPLVEYNILRLPTILDGIPKTVRFLCSKFTRASISTVIITVVLQYYIVLSVRWPIDECYAVHYYNTIIVTQPL